MDYQYLKADDFITKTIVFDYSDSLQSGHPLHICFGLDQNFLFGCGISITSILINNKQSNFVFHLFIDNVTDEQTLKFQQLAESYQTSIEIHIINSERLQSFPTTKNWSIATYFRFIIGDYFINREERILYMDADIMCKGDISELFTLDLTDHVAAVVPERDASWWERRAKSLDCEALNNGYFNAGLLLLNTALWAQEHVSAKALGILSDSQMVKKLSYLDQDILNVILAGKVLFIDGKFNTQFSLNYELKDDVVNPINDKTVFIHYIGPTKPWHEWANYPSAQAFLQAKEKSPWEKSPLMKPGNSHHARYCAKHYFKQGRMVEGMKAYIYYFYLKVLG